MSSQRRSPLADDDRSTTRVKWAFFIGGKADTAEAALQSLLEVTMEKLDEYGGYEFLDGPRSLGLECLECGEGWFYDGTMSV